MTALPRVRPPPRSGRPPVIDKARGVISRTERNFQCWAARGNCESRQRLAGPSDERTADSASYKVGVRFAMMDSGNALKHARPSTLILEICPAGSIITPSMLPSGNMGQQASRSAFDSLLTRTHVQHALIQPDGRHNDVPTVCSHVT